jgi:charged multivesicular body protein 5
MLAWRGTGSVTQDLDVNRIEAMQDEMSDLMEQSNEIQDVLGRNYSVPDDLDEEARKALPIDNRIV